MITFNVNTTVNGVANTQIGSITANFTYTAPDAYAETGVFNLNATGAALNSCYQFRWYQIVTSAPAALLKNPQLAFKNPQGVYNQQPVLPFVDPPNGGYKYQQADGGADNQPFYENTDPGNYAYPNYSAKHVQGVSSSTSDNPTPRDVTFQTYLVATGMGIAANTFDVLAGYQWSTALMGMPRNVAAPTQITPINLGPLNTALMNSGFIAAGYNDAWTAVTGVNLQQCPEPSSFFLLLTGVCFGIVVFGRGFVARRLCDLATRRA